MRVLLLNQSYHPDVVATAQHAHDVGAHLARAGHEVHVITSRSLYNGRGASLPAREIVEGVTVHRVGASIFGKSTIALRSIDSALFLVLATAKALVIPRPDVVLALCNPPFVAAAGRLLGAVKGVPYVYWLMDLYPDLPVACGAMDEGSLPTRFFDALNTALIRSSTRAVVLGRCMGDRVSAKGVPQELLAIVPPWADAREVFPVARDENPLRSEWGLGTSFVVMYSGNFGLGHDLATPCRAALTLAGRADMAFVFVGGGKRRGEVEAFASAHPEARIHVHPYQPRERLHASLGVADVHVISLEDRALGAMIPSKLFGIMAAARPAVFIGPGSSEIARIIREVGCGIVVPPGDERALADAIISLAENRGEAAAVGRRGREALERVYDRPLACARLEALLVEAAGAVAAAETAGRRANGTSSRGA